MLHRIYDDLFASSDSYLCSWAGDGFVLDLFDAFETDEYGKSILRYSFRDETLDPFTLFSGADFHVSPIHAVDSLETAASLLGFLSLRPGDTDGEYFAKYTPRQLAWTESERAEELALLVYDMENEAEPTDGGAA